MNADKQRLGHNFSRQTSRYDCYAHVQRRLADQLLQNLVQQPENFGHILEIGCGTGYFTSLLRRYFPTAQITAVDLAPAALEAARARLGDAAGIDWRLADAEHEVPGMFDLITASSVFQWLSQPERACRLYWEHLQPGGVLAFTSLGPQTFQELAASFAQAGMVCPDLSPPEIPAQGFACGREWKIFLEQAGFGDIVWHDDLWLEQYADTWAFLRAVQGMGATSTRPAFLPRRLLTAAIKHYEGTYRHNGIINVTFEIISASAKKIFI
jgi:malonyl-CoA O-methyltransferase